MNIKKLYLIAAGILIAGTTWAATQVYRDQSTNHLEITTQGTDFIIKIEEVRYIKDFLYTYGGDKTPLLVKVTTQKTSQTNLDGVQGQSEIEVRSSKDFFAKPLWTVKDEGQEVVALNEEFVGTIQYGCCDAPNVTNIYNVENGNLVATTLDTLFTITVPNSGLKDRYLSVIEDKGAPTQKNDKDLLGTFGYFDSTGRISKVRIYVKITPGWGTRLEDLKLVTTNGKTSRNALGYRDTMELWDSDSIKDAKLAFKGFGVYGEINFDNKNFKFLIPVDGDIFNASKAQLSPGLAIEVL